jgi:large subunit ribosomal protein L24
MSKWIKKDDKVVVITGNEKGKVGKVLSRQGDKVVVQGLNIRSRHIKRRSRTPTPGIVEMETPFHISNVSICNEDGKPVKLKVRHSKDGKKELFYLQDSKEVMYRQI